MGGERWCFQVVTLLEGFQFDKYQMPDIGISGWWKMQIWGTKTRITCYASMLDVWLSELGWNVGVWYLWRDRETEFGAKCNVPVEMFVKCMSVSKGILRHCPQENLENHMSTFRYTNMLEYLHYEIGTSPNGNISIFTFGKIYHINVLNICKYTYNIDIIFKQIYLYVSQYVHLARYIISMY